MEGRKDESREPAERGDVCGCWEGWVVVVCRRELQKFETPHLES